MPDGVGIVQMLLQKREQNPCKKLTILESILWRVSESLLVLLGGPLCLSKAILGAWKARKWQPFACFQPSTFSRLEAPDGTSGRLWPPSGPLLTPKLIRKVAQKSPKIVPRGIQKWTPKLMICLTILGSILGSQDHPSSLPFQHVWTLMGPRWPHLP